MIISVDLVLIALFASFLVGTYYAGTYWKHKTLTTYAHWFNDNLSPKGKVKFASYGHQGLRVKCEITDRTTGFREIHLALTLGARENPMYYPLGPLMGNFDKVLVWGHLDKPLPTSLTVMKKYNRQNATYSKKNQDKNPVDLIALGYNSHVAYATNIDQGREIVRKLPQGWDAHLELLDLDRASRTIRVAAKLKRESLPELMSFVFTLGRYPAFS